MGQRYLCEDKDVDDLLGLLAYDLEYFVRNPEWRREDTTYIDENVAKDRIREHLRRLPS